MKERMPIAIMIGRGSRLPAILDYTQRPDSPVEVKIVISHKKQEENGQDVFGISLARKHGIPAVYFNLPNFEKNTGKSRAEYDAFLGWFLSQPYYNPQLIFLTGWDLILSENFLKFFPWKDGFYRVMNVHPNLLPDNPQSDEVTLSNGQKVPAIRGKHGEAAIQEALDRKLPYTGSSIHFVTEKVDVGPVVCRAEVEVKPQDTVQTLYPRIQAEEDKMGSSAIDLFASGKLDIEDNKIKIK